MGFSNRLSKPSEYLIAPEHFVYDEAKGFADICISHVGDPGCPLAKSRGLRYAIKTYPGIWAGTTDLLGASGMSFK